MKDSDWEILDKLHKTQNITKAANMLYMTQPALTKRLQRMEAEFQVEIVKRTQRGLKFTPQGEYLAERAEQYLKFIQETKEQLGRTRGSISLTIGSAYTYSKYCLSDILYEYSCLHPEVSFQVVNEQSNLLFEHIQDGSFDAAFVTGDYEGNVNQILMEQRKAYLVTKESVAFDKLVSMQRLEYRTSDRTEELLESWWQNQFHTNMPKGMNVGYIDFAWQLISKGLGYTCCFLPENFENEYQLCLTKLEENGQEVIRNTYFIYRKNKKFSREVKEFIHYIKQKALIQ